MDNNINFLFMLLLLLFDLKCGDSMFKSWLVSCEFHPDITIMADWVYTKQIYYLSIYSWMFIMQLFIWWQQQNQKVQSTHTDKI